MGQITYTPTMARQSWLILEAAEAAGQPDIHTGGATMVPSVVGDEFYGDVLRSEFAFGCDRGFLGLRLNGSDVEGLAIALFILDAIGWLEVELGLVREQQVVRIDALVVSSFCTIDQRSALYGHASTIVCHARTGHNRTNRHIEMDADDIALLPVAIDDHIAVLHVAIHALAIYGNLISAENIIAIAIQIAGHDLALYPTRDANHHVERLGLVLEHFDANVTIPGIVGLLLDRYILTAQGDGSCVGSKEVHIKVVAAHAIDIARHRGDETAEVRGTAGAAEPRLARQCAVGIETVTAVARERVGVEELATIDAHTADDTIIQCALHAVNVFGIAM